MNAGSMNIDRVTFDLAHANVLAEARARIFPRKQMVATLNGTYRVFDEQEEIPFEWEIVRTVKQ